MPNLFSSVESGPLPRTVLPRYRTGAAMGLLPPE
jgi:hypothetical protein